jgi:hypothetical protein
MLYLFYSQVFREVELGIPFTENTPGGGVRVKKDADIKGNPATATLKPPSRIVTSARTFTDLCTAVSQRAKAREEICGLKGSVRDPARSVAWLNKLDDGHHDAILMGEVSLYCQVFVLFMFVLRL